METGGILTGKSYVLLTGSLTTVGFATRVFRVSCVKDFYMPPLPKTLAGVVFKRRQCRQIMERLESASTKNFLTNAEMVYHFRRAGGVGVGGVGGVGWGGVGG